MEFEDLVILIATGGIAGWLANLLVRNGGFNILGNIIIGVIGAFIGTKLFEILEIGFGNRYVGALTTATVGAVILLLVMSVLLKLTKKK